MRPRPTSLQRALRTIAWSSIILSFPVTIAAFVVVPFLPLAPAVRIALVGGFIAAGELMFWPAGAYLGAEFLARFRTPKVRTGKSFAGKRIAVVGATGGLGLAIAHAVRREGGLPVLVGRHAERLRPIGDALGSAHFTVELDNAQAIEDAASAIAAQGAIDHVVNAAGVDVRKPLLSHSLAEIDTQLSIDLRAPMLLTKAFLPRLAPGGTIALLGGFADGRLALPYYAPDVAARAGLAGFCEAMNRELAVEDRTERVCFISPAPADTEAERPYAELWRKMGSPPVAAERVADFVLQTLITRRSPAVMGRATRLFALLNAVAPFIADLLLVRRFGPLLRARFGNIALPQPEESFSQPVVQDTFLTMEHARDV